MLHPPFLLKQGALNVMQDSHLPFMILFLTAFAVLLEMVTTLSIMMEHCWCQEVISQSMNLQSLAHVQQQIPATPQWAQVPAALWQSL